jgi:hypothetical protein
MGWKEAGIVDPGIAGWEDSDYLKAQKARYNARPKKPNPKYTKPNPSTGEIYFHRALSKKQLGDFGGAEADFKTARELGFHKLI